ncbi:MAG: prolyl oligopeptidase family serine peptidase, partial [Bacteroidota bacterium]|nr:prolyl oligopeptidase family serine peptidase [Candidatus Kapabacteria bacterium]MDW8221142.1 prolyl oligopeptidase family serine peptidase [Bacteroidota bacterium]
MKKPCIIRQLLLYIACICTPFQNAPAQQPTYKLPPATIAQIIDSPVFPTVLPSPTGTAVLLIETKPNPSIELLAEPIVKLAGERISTRTHALQRRSEVYSMTIQPTNPAATSIRIGVPAQSRLGNPLWSHDGSLIAFTRDAPGGMELWIADARTGKASKIPSIRPVDIFGMPYSWIDNSTVLVKAIPAERGAPPALSPVPRGPIVEESIGKRMQVRTYQDLLQNPDDERLFEYYCTVQLLAVHLPTGKRTPIGKPGLITSAEYSPDKKYLLVTKLTKPFSYRVPWTEFAKTIELWDSKGTLVRLIASLPVQDQIPRQGVPTGVRNVVWQALQPATLLWVEALDGGDPTVKADARDRVYTLSAPFTGEARILFDIRHRFAGFGWTATPNLITYTEFDRDRRWRTTYLKDLTKPDSATILFDLSIHNSYNDPGTPVYEHRPTGERVFAQDGDWIYLSGTGATPQGDRPFLDKFHLKTREKQRLFRASEQRYETFICFVGTSRTRILTRAESTTEYPNLALVDISSQPTASTENGIARTYITTFTDPAPALASLKKELIKYRRADGVPLSGTLYLPPSYKAGERLPLIIWAYPLEYSDAATAGQIRSQPNRYTQRSRSYSTIYLALQGYAVLYDATMPIVGSPETANDTFIEQITASAQAAIDYLDSLGIIDRQRVGVAGHSYGAFMTANLLAHTNLFAAGIACSGAYNRSLTPFGF